MSPPLLVTEEEGQNKVSSMVASASSQSLDCFSQTGVELKERNYMGLSDCSSVDSSSPTVPSFSDEKKGILNLKATELRLGLPGSQSPERITDLYSLSSAKLDEKPLFPLLPMKDEICLSSQKTVVSGNKRGFADTMDGFPQGKFTGNTGMGVMLSPRPSGAQPRTVQEIPNKVLQERPCAANDSSISSMAPASKAQVVGWPPIRSFRKNSMATTSKNNEVDGKPGPTALFVKVSMDGAPYLRKVDLRNYTTYQELSCALEKMFSCFTLGQCGSHGAPGKEMLSESKLRDLLRGSEYVVTYEDKDGDWMLVGDVPWEMFIDTCRRLKIMKGSDAIGLAPRAMEKSKSRS
ncbi:PREDICTED: auxin-responsive protein IAA9-like [Lupinus angustifolius]|uniref:auxin-responsive protein IAA9-like n=1 Tax=Lupinus angustifolius TaxID=3871 RepID=UPI00092E2F7C|nr:PREDICTED: auxin-responsive protein IAA9-like [Lupinus angustifolius]XP_019423995.1 PREDICTED: auxin-responsive protein IAA9-like [Lupinus angustifolius]XP_019423996.1 PREDICTED: auxin-responsive protein IAA9-like [Lupinus angustifolius]